LDAVGGVIEAGTIVKSALSPTAVLELPVVLLTRAPVPRLVLVCAAALPARESKKINATIRTTKNEAVLVELRII